MKLLFITEYFPATIKVDVHGGVEVRTYEIARRIARRHQVEVIASRELDKPKIQKLAGMTIYRVGPARTYSAFGHIWVRFLFNLFAIRRGLMADFDVVEGAGLIGWLPTYVISLVKNKKRTIVVADVVEEYVKGTSLLIRVVLTVLQKFIFKKHWDGIICISHTIADKLANLGIRKNVKIIYCGVDIEKIRELAVTKRTNHISCVARLVSYKRVDDLIKAMAIVKQAIPRVKLEIVGIGEDETKLKNITHKLSLGSSVLFHGFIKNQHQVWRLIKSTSVFCLPSVVEGFGLVTLEALAAGVPVILADIPVNHEVTNDQGALFFRPADPEDLARKLVTLLTDKNIYRKLSGQALKMATHYNWQDVSKQAEKLYEDLCTH